MPKTSIDDVQDDARRVVRAEVLRLVQERDRIVETIVVDRGLGLAELLEELAPHRADARAIDEARGEDRDPERIDDARDVALAVGVPPRAASEARPHDARHARIWPSGRTSVRASTCHARRSASHGCVSTPYRRTASVLANAFTRSETVRLAVT